MHATDVGRRGLPRFMGHRSLGSTMPNLKALCPWEDFVSRSSTPYHFHAALAKGERRLFDLAMHSSWHVPIVWVPEPRGVWANGPSTPSSFSSRGEVELLVAHHGNKVCVTPLSSKEGSHPFTTGSTLQAYLLCNCDNLLSKIKLALRVVWPLPQ